MSATDTPTQLKNRTGTSTDSATLMSIIDEGIKDSLTQQDTGVSYPQYMNLYTAVHNYCTASRLQGSFGGITLDNHSSGNFMGHDLYEGLRKRVITHLEERQKESERFVNQDLLHFYATEWDRFKSSRKYLNGWFTTLNRDWVRSERLRGRKDVYEVNTLVLVLWRDQLFYPTRNKLVSVLLETIEKERNGETINADSIKKAIDSFVSLGLNDNQNKEQLDIYEKEFQIPFIEATEKYYTRESAKWMQNSPSIKEYLEKAVEYLGKEEDRVERYLHFSTGKPLMSICEDILVRTHLGTIQEELQKLLSSDKHEDFRSIFRLLARIPEAYKLLRKIFEEDVKKAQLTAIFDEQKDAASALGGEAEPNDKTI